MLGFTIFNKKPCQVKFKIYLRSHPHKYLKGIGMKATKKSCDECGSNNVKTCLRVYPVKIETKQLNVNRTSVKECLDCSAMMPTKAGKEKIERAIMNFMTLMMRHNPTWTEHAMNSMDFLK